MAVIRLNASDIAVAYELYMASPDGQAEQARIEDWMDSLPDATLTISGYFVEDHPSGQIQPPC